MKEIYYFGCKDMVGHYLFHKEDGHIRSCRYTPSDFNSRFGHSGGTLDGTFTPPVNWSTQRWMGSTVGHWLIVSWWDNSVDSRPGSHSTFISKDVESYEELVEQAKIQYPEIFARQPAVLAGPAVIRRKEDLCAAS